MTGVELYADLQAHGATFKVVGPELRVVADEDVLGDDVVRLLRIHKQEIMAILTTEVTPPRTPAVALPPEWQRTFDSIVASNMLCGGRPREYAEHVALGIVQEAMSTVPGAPRRDPMTGETEVERAERYLREAGGLPPGARRVKP